MQTVRIVETVLGNEIENPDGVYMYLEGDTWCAYERSAYYLASLLVPVKLKKEVIGEGYDVVLMKASLPTDSISIPLAPSVTLEKVADNLLFFRIRKEFDGFYEWKKEKINYA